jgi:hypothetical protein
LGRNRVPCPGIKLRVLLKVCANAIGQGLTVTTELPGKSPIRVARKDWPPCADHTIHGLNDQFRSAIVDQEMEGRLRTLTCS